MNEDTARAMIKAHFDASNVSAAGGGPGDDIARASEIYADDVAEPWEPPDWRARWVERFDPRDADSSLTWEQPGERPPS